MSGARGHGQPGGWGLCVLAAAANHPPAPLPPPTRASPSPPQIVEAVAPVRDRLDACVVFPSMPAVMKLNKLGTFSMAQLGQSKSMIGEFIK